MFGHDVSGYLVNHLPQNINTSLLKSNIKSISNSADYSKISDIISFTFVQTNINIINDDNVDSTFSGTTCSSLIFCPTKIISANVGDSRCVVGKFDGKNWKAKNLTRDHKPSEEDEKKRIIEKGGRIESYKDEVGEFVGPERVWLKKEDVPGLAMSRSFGDDVAHTVGVIAQPEIFEYNFVNEDKFLLLASDGIWEFISSDECVNIVKDYYLKDDIDGALNYLYKESSKRWIMEEEVIDDITLIIIFLN
jgi:serine/threonine protein phosphatase PrpC